MLAPVFDEAADKVRAAFPEAGRVVMGKVDCDKEVSVATRFHISKYPTLKLIRNGQPAKREYRGKRSAEAFLEFITKQLEDPIKEFTDLAELKKLDVRMAWKLLGYIVNFSAVVCLQYKEYVEERKFPVLTAFLGSDPVRTMHPPGEPIIVFRPDVALSNERDETFKGSLLNYDEVSVWTSERCLPLVREITFENAEELTEEGLPFLILFHRLGQDEETVKRYKDIVNNELISEKQNINFLTADGEKFAHPLHHLGKSISDLPLIAIDSFRHMYLFPDVKQMDVPGRLKQFISDLYSGKLHREYHYGPDPNDIMGNPSKDGTTPPESTFKKLGPSPNRYTLLRDEL
ncbi:unnamed protein product [Nesidiocoris tenuis]|uniref:Thioredoxin domain-containing protein n=1 Tax=Nesidiocoris tenuis TaxID=355587 RepID=A0A6H5GYR4_9HEMI|nr:unnamed protein product [Nesidiocoris tenuis]